MYFVTVPPLFKACGTPAVAVFPFWCTSTMLFGDTLYFVLLLDCVQAESLLRCACFALRRVFSPLFSAVC